MASKYDKPILKRCAFELDRLTEMLTHRLSPGEEDMLRTLSRLAERTADEDGLVLPITAVELNVL